MSNQIKVSVILPSLNVVQYIKECMDSVINQTLKQIEIICVDAGSTDGTLEILNEYAKIDQRVKIIVSDKKSYGYQMNLGIDAANGEYIGIVETDDYVELNMFEELYLKAKELSLDFIKSDFNRFINEGNDVKKTLNKLSKDESYYNIVLKPMDNINTFKFIMNTWCGIYNLDFLRKNNIRHNETLGASYQDNGFWFQTFAFADRAYFSEQAYYMNRRDNANSSIFNKGKIYTMKHEYDFIREIIRLKAPNNQTMIELCTYFRFCGYFYNTLNRIAPEFRLEFIDCFSKEFKGYANNCEFNKELFTKTEWNALNTIIYDPIGYCSQIRGVDTYHYTLSTQAESEVTISIIIPVYNVEDYLSECLDSILTQNFTDYEIICVNDGSTDNSLEILEQYKSKYKRIKIVNQENQGLSSARNTGLENATGKYVWFVDSDDFISKKALANLSNIIKKDKSEVIVFGFNPYNSDVNIEIPSWYNGKNPTINKVFSDFTIENYFQNIYLTPFVWRTIIKREVLINSQIRFIPHTEPCEDTIFMFEIFCFVKLVSVTKSHFYNYRVERKDSIMSESFKDKNHKLCMHLNAVSILNEVINKNKINDSIRTYFCSWVCNFIFPVFKQLDLQQKNDICNDLVIILNDVFRGNEDKLLGPQNSKIFNDIISMRNNKQITDYNFNQDKEDVMNIDKDIQPIFSIIMPVYNMDKYIESSMKSLMNQTLKNIEIICVDDASTDDTLNILNRLSMKDSRVKIISYSKNKTSNIARRDAVLASNGKYILFCDADDSYELDACEKLKLITEKYPVDIIHYGTNIINNNADEKDIIWLQQNMHPYYRTIYDEDVLNECFINNKYDRVLWNKAFRADFAKKAFEAVNPIPIRRGQDLYAYAILAYYAKSYKGVVGYSLYNYNIGLGGDGTKVMTEDNFVFFAELNKVALEITRFFEKENKVEEYAEVIKNINERLFGDCVNKWEKKISDDDKGKCFDHMINNWEPWRVINGVAKRYWYNPQEITTILTKSKIRNTVSTEPHTIAMYYHKLKNGGVEEVMLSLAKIYVAMGYEVILITDLQTNEDIVDLPEGIKRVAIPNYGNANSNMYYQRAYALQEVLIENAVDIYINHAWNTTMLTWDMLLVKSLGIPFIIHCHNVFTLRLLSGDDYFAIMPRIYSFADAIIALSETDRQYWSNFNANVKVVVNPIEVDKNVLKASKPISTNILWVGRISEEKCPNEAIEIMDLVKNECPNAILHMVGGENDGQVNESLMKLVKAKGLEKNVILHGFKDDVTPYYKEAGIYLCTSKYEGFPIAVFDAKAHGLPIVSYDMPYLTMFEGYRGILETKPHDIKSAANNIVDIMTNDELRSKLSHESKVHANELINFDYIAKWKNIFDSVATSERTPLNQQNILMWETMFSHYLISNNKNRIQSRVQRNNISNMHNVKNNSLIKKFMFSIKNEGIKITIKRVINKFKKASIISRLIKSLKQEGSIKTVKKIYVKLCICLKHN